MKKMKCGVHVLFYDSKIIMSTDFSLKTDFFYFDFTFDIAQFG